MEGWFELILIVVAVGIALAANSLSALSAQKDKIFTWWLLAVILISPLVFITFGYVTHYMGVAIGAGTLDSLLSVSTIIVGLVFFGERKTLSGSQFFGLSSIVLGILLLQIPQ